MLSQSHSAAFLEVEEEVWLDELQLHEPDACGGFDKVQAGVEDVLLALRIQPLDCCLVLCVERDGVLGDAQVIVRPEFTGLGYSDDGMAEVIVEEGEVSPCAISGRNSCTSTSLERSRLVLRFRFFADFSSDYFHDPFGRSAIAGLDDNLVAGD